MPVGYTRRSGYNAAMRYLLTLSLICCMGCATAKDALTIVAPIAAQHLADLVRERFEAEPDQETAGCESLAGDPEVDAVTADTGEVYVLCWAGAE